MHHSSHRFLIASLVVLSLLTGACNRFASGVIHATGTSRNVLVGQGEFNQDVELWYESATSYRAIGSGDEVFGVGTMYIREGDRLAVACYLSNRELSATIGPVSTDPFLVWHADTGAVGGGQVVTHDSYDDLITHFDLYDSDGEWSLTLNYTDVERLDDTPLGTIEDQLATYDADIPDCGA